MGKIRGHEASGVALQHGVKGARKTTYAGEGSYARGDREDHENKPAG